MKDLEHVQFKGPFNKNCDFNFMYQSPWEQKKSFKVFSPGKFEDLVVVSPFLNGNVLKKLEDSCRRFYLITGEMDLAQLKKLKHRLKTSFILQSENMGIHAKIYIGRRKGSEYTDVYVGSANCTRRGLDGDNVEAMMHMQAPKNYYDRFVENFIYENYGSKVLNPWLRHIDEAEVDQEIEETDKEIIKKELETLRDKISTGLFHVAFTPKKKSVAVTYHNEQNIDIPHDITVSFRMFGQKERSDSGSLFKGEKVSFNAKLSEVSTFISIILEKNEVTLSFWTVAVGFFDRAIRRRALIRDIIQDWDGFLKYLRSILDISSLPTLKKQIVENDNGDKGDDGKNGGKGPRVAGLFDMAQILEQLLINVGANKEQIERIDDVFNGLDKKGIKDNEAEYNGFQKIWVEYKEACQIFGRDA